MKIEAFGVKVIGDEIDGFEIEKVLAQLGEIEITDPGNEAELFGQLFIQGILGHEGYDIDDVSDGTFVANVVDSETGRPVVQLKEIDENESSYLD